MPLVILEGPDGAGKSTLAQKLLKGTGQPTLLVRRSGPPSSIETIAFQGQWIANQSRARLNILCDRHPSISEAIYAPTVRKAPPPPWTLDDVAVAMRRVTNRILLIYCRTRDDSMLAGSKVESQMEGVHENYPALLAEYDRWFEYLEKYGIPVYRYDYRKDPLAKVAIQEVKTFWERHA